VDVLISRVAMIRRLVSRLSLVSLLAAAASLGLAGLVSSQVSRPSVSGGSGTSLEYQVKAAYLLNFTRYVEWPAQAFAAPDSPVTICVLGIDPFGNVLDATTRGRTTQGRTVAVRRIRTIARTDECHLLFISRKTWRTQRDLPKKLRAPGLLTVGESEDFAQEGGVISFIIQNETVRFVVNAEARDQAGLRISSRMLSLAAAVYGQRAGT
jgi:hypothetical protein